MTKVIQFPNRRKEIAEEQLEDKIGPIDMVAEELLSDMVAELIEMGIDLTGDTYLYDVSYVYETLRSLLLKAHDMDHPIQAICSGIYRNILDEQHRRDAQLEFDF